MAELHLDDSPYKADRSLTPGNTLVEGFSIEVNGVAKDLSDCTVTFQAWTSEEKTPVYVDGNGDSDPVEVSPLGSSHNQLPFPMTSAETATWSGKYIYAFTCVFPVGDPDVSSGGTRTIIAGSIVVVPLP